MSRYANAQTANACPEYPPACRDESGLALDSEAFRGLPDEAYARFIYQKHIINAAIFNEPDAPHVLERLHGIPANNNPGPDCALLPDDELQQELKLRNTASAAVTLSDLVPSSFFGQTKNDYASIFGRRTTSPYGGANTIYSCAGKMSASYANAPYKVGGNGEKLSISDDDIVLSYSYDHDTRPYKDECVPTSLRQGTHEIARWRGADRREDFDTKFQAVCIWQPKDATAKAEGRANCVLCLNSMTYDDLLEGLVENRGWFKYDPNTSSEGTRWYSNFKITNRGIAHFLRHAIVVDESGLVTLDKDYPVRTRA